MVKAATGGVLWKYACIILVTIYNENQYSLVHIKDT
jgi:hypothetical protein